MSRPNPARSLSEAVEGMSWSLAEGRYALLGFDAPPEGSDLADLLPGPGQLVREGGETSLLVARERLAAARARHPDARVEDGLVWVRFHAPMGWEVVGFLARVAGELAAAGVPLGVVCGFSRDSLFVAEGHLEATRAVLTRLFGPPVG